MGTVQRAQNTRTNLLGQLEQTVGSEVKKFERAFAAGLKSLAQAYLAGLKPAPQPVADGFDAEQAPAQTGPSWQQAAQLAKDGDTVPPEVIRQMVKAGVLPKDALLPAKARQARPAPATATTSAAHALAPTVAPAPEASGQATPKQSFHAGGTASSTIHLDGGFDLDKLTLKLDAHHRDLTGLEVTVTSPSGKNFTLPDPHARTVSQAVDLSQAFAGEQVAGDWKVSVHSKWAHDTGQLASWSLDAVGAAPPPPPPAPPLWSSSRPGMGAIPYDGGTTFRVWAPNAEQVFVAGDFNGWQPTEIGNEFNGNFSGDLAGAKPGQGYKFLIRNGDNWIWRADPRAQQMSNSTGNSIIHDPNSYQWHHDLDFKMPPKNQTVMYEMNVDTYQGFFGGHGNWNSAIDKLQHLKDLGINMIELMPTAEFPGDVSWGYNPADPFAPESAFGSPDDMKRFIDTAHSMGIGVTLDVVYNHFGPNDLSMWDFDGEGYPGDGGIYFYNDWKQQTPWGPRPNYGRKEVQDYIVDNAMQWLGEYHLDGLRLDATEDIRAASGADNPDGWNVLKRINDQVNQRWPWKRIIAEDMQNDAAITQGSGAGFDEQWDPDFYSKVDGQVLEANDSWIDMNQVKDAILHNIDGDPFSRVIYSQSHDEVANGKSYLESMVDPSNPGSYYAKKKQTLAAALALTSAGTPMLFQGQEFNEAGSFQAEHPLDWNNLNYFGGINQMYTDLIHLRRNWNNNTQGLSGANTNVFHVDNNNKVIAYQRWDQGGPGDDTIVIVNMSSKPMKNYDIGLPSGGDWKVRFNSDWKGYSPDFNGTSTFDVGAQGGGMDGLSNHGQLDIGPYSVVILSKDR